MKENDIKTLIDGCINRDEASWSKFITRFSGLAYWAITDRLKRWRIQFSSEDAEDIKQQTFLNIWEKNRLSEIRDTDKVDGWLVIVAGNFAFNYMRDRSRANPPILDSTFKEDLKIEEISDAQDIYQTLQGGEVRAVIQNFIDKLPPPQRTVLVLNYFYGKKHKEIAEVLKIPINTVSTIIKRSKDALRKELKRNEIF